MGADDYRIDIRCGRCKLQLFRSPKSVTTSPIVFCDYCLSGGPYKDVVEEGKHLTVSFVTREHVDQMLSEMGVNGK